MPTDLVIAPGLAEADRLPAAHILYEAFRRKLGPLIGRPERVPNVLAAGLQPERALSACVSGTLVGVAGLHYGGRRFLRVSWPECRRQLGVVRGLCGGLILELFWREACPPGQLRLPALAVAAAQRGLGVGSGLLQAAFALARREHFSAVRLEVVDSNVGARRLYERLGFAPVAEHHYPFLRGWLGFSSAVVLVRALDE